MAERWTVATLLLLIWSYPRLHALTVPSKAVPGKERARIGSKQAVSFQSRRPTERRFHPARDKKRCDPCQPVLDDTQDDADQGRREAAFAMLGTIWAAGAIPTALIFPQAANGNDANIELPNVVQGMDDRQNKQCLVESLGNRECLAYMDEANKLYKGKGVDNKLLLERIEKASVALASVPGLVEAKCWSKVIGVLTGPMGELIRNMGQLADLSENSLLAKDSIKQVKADLYAISAAVDRKDQIKALQSRSAATNDLVAFVKAL
jgi:hypothetical protein